MYTGPLPTATVWGTWSEAIGIYEAESNDLMDLSDVTEIKLILRDTVTRFDELTLLMSDGSITVPSTGVIEWRVEANQMASVPPKTYEVILLLSNDTDTVPVIVGSVSIVE